MKTSLCRKKSNNVVYITKDVTLSDGTKQKNRHVFVRQKKTKKKFYQHQTRLGKTHNTREIPAVAFLFIPNLSPPRNIERALIA